MNAQDEFFMRILCVYLVFVDDVVCLFWLWCKDYAFLHHVEAVFAPI
ncbi:hypothetical protein D083_1699 [Dickeya solani RNS 08.23.3.1.A]|nr:hypothetical protein D083_1699 [Dickeya solani RNS 08.23.3.1.A]